MVELGLGLMATFPWRKNYTMKTAVLPPLRNSYALLPICLLLFSSDNIIFVVLLGGNGGGGKGQEMESDSDEGQEGSSSGTTDQAWHEWTEWSECSKSCGDNSWKIRSRTCNSVIAASCHGDSIQVTFCDVRPCWKIIIIKKMDFSWARYFPSCFLGLARWSELGQWVSLFVAYTCFSEQLF